MRNFFLSILFLTTLAGSASAADPVFVLVHGALFTKEGWSLLESSLQVSGQNVVSVNVPGRAGDGLKPADVNLNRAAERICKVVNLQRAPVILVGHSQGGAVITQALAICPQNIQGLVFIAAVVPKNGETAFQGLNPTEDVNFEKCATYNDTEKAFVLNRSGPLEESFFQDLRKVDSRRADIARLSMVSEPAAIGTTQLNFPQPIFDALPKFYIETTLDNILTIGTQRKYQSRIKWNGVYTMEASHSPFLSKPEELAEHLVTVKKTISANAQKDSDNVAVVKKYFEALRSGKFELLNDLFADDIVWHQPGNGQLSGLHSGKPAVFNLFGRFGKISQGSFKIDSVANVMENGNWVTATLHFSATANDKAISMDGVDLMRIENGKIKEVYLFSADQDAEDKFWVD